MSIEERVRAAAETEAETVRYIRPLTLPERNPARLHSFRSSGTRRTWAARLAPLVSAAAIVAVAATLVAVKGTSPTTSTAQSRPSVPSNSVQRSAPALSAAATPAASKAGILPGIPSYYVTLNDVNGTQTADAVLGDTTTGKALATFNPPANQYWHVAISASDNTFILYGNTDSAKVSAPAWDVLHVSSSAPQQTRLAKIPIAVSYAKTSVAGVAVSLDGSTFAVLSTTPGSVTQTLRTFSTGTGQLLRTWTGSNVGTTAGRISWLDDDHTLAFTYLSAGGAGGTWQVQTLNTTSPGTNLNADLKTVGSVAATNGGNCSSALLTADGKSVICGSNESDGQTCEEMDSYSVATGKLEDVLYRYQGACQAVNAVPEWAPSGSLAIGVITPIASGSSTSKATPDIGVMTPTQFTPLPITQTEAIDGINAYAAF